LKSNIIISEKWNDLLPLIGERKVFVIKDSNINNVPIPARWTTFEIEAIEENKSFLTIENLVGKLLEAGADRDSFILGVGGGITTDVAGFTASIYKRGVQFGFVPTTLLAQVDASIGGKNGVNFCGLKNMVGVIRQPEFVFVNPDVLKTLPNDVFICGVAEMLKAFIIDDREMFLRFISGARNNFKEFITRAIQIKCAIVEQDENEKGLRRVLNLGHTFAHAIENCSGLSHGKAVAIGICIASRISVSMGLMSNDECMMIVDNLGRAGLPTECDIAFERLEKAIAQDKKSQGGKINFVLPEEVGKVVVKPLTMNQIRDGYSLL